MTAATANTDIPDEGFEATFSQSVEEASFLWLLRSMAVEQPHYTPADLSDLEKRIDSRLMTLLMSPDSAWHACVEALAIGEPGEVFVAAVVAFRSLEVDRIQVAVEAGLTGEPCFKALVSAMGWLPGRYVHAWIRRFLTSKDLRHKRLAVAACRVRREDPCGYLTRIIQREDCRADEGLYAECLRTVGVFKRRDLLAELERASCDENEAIALRGRLSGALLGESGYSESLKPFAQTPGPYQTDAFRLAVRALPGAQAKRWIGQVLREHNQYRLAIQATAALGDPEAMPWLIGCMREPTLARVAGEAFYQVTGIDLQAHELSHRLPQLEEPVPNDDPEDERVAMDEDEHLPWPNSEKITALWTTVGHRYRVGERYLLGRPIQSGHLRTVYDRGAQRQRAAAALEWALSEPARILPNAKERQEASL